MFQVFKRFGAHRDPRPLSAVFEDMASARQWAEDYLTKHPRGCGAEALDLRRIAQSARR